MKRLLMKVLAFSAMGMFLIVGIKVYGYQYDTYQPTDRLIVRSTFVVLEDYQPLIEDPGCSVIECKLIRLGVDDFYVRGTAFHYSSTGVPLPVTLHLKAKCEYKQCSKWGFVTLEKYYYLRKSFSEVGTVSGLMNVSGHTVVSFWCSCSDH